jgi:ABC-type transport system involved in multi-copper enzyme maturation permease subunit
MNRLLSIELQKIWLNKASRILTLTYFILLTFIALIASIEFDFGPFKFHMADMGIFNFPYIWHFNTYIASILKFFLAIVIISMIANEYSYGTLKQNLIDGLSKKEFLLSKFLTIVLLAAISTFFVFVMSLILGYSFSEDTSFSLVFTDLEYLLAYFVKLVGFFSFCLFIGILVKSSGFSIGFLFVWWIFEKILRIILGIFLFNNSGEKADYAQQFFPLESMSRLILEPFTKNMAVQNMGTQIGIENTTDYSVHWYSVLTVLIWVVIFMLMSYKLLKKRDL